MHQVKLFIKSSVPFFSSAGLRASHGQTNIATGAPGLQRVDKRQGQHLKTAEKHLQLYPKIVGFGQCFAQLFKPLIPLLPVQLQETFQKRCDTVHLYPMVTHLCPMVTKLFGILIVDIGKIILSQAITAAESQMKAVLPWLLQQCHF